MRHAFLMFLCLAASGAASALTLTSNAAGSARINCQSGTFSMDIFFNSTNNGFCESQGVAEFDVSGTGLLSVANATLTLFSGASYNSAAPSWPLDLYGYVGDGQVTSGDYDVGTYFGSAAWVSNAQNPGALIIDVTDYVNTQLALGTDIIGINIRPNLLTHNCCTTTWISFDGSDDPGSPTLSLHAVPVPATVWLFGSALGLMGVIRRKAVA